MSPYLWALIIGAVAGCLIYLVRRETPMQHTMTEEQIRKIVSEELDKRFNVVYPEDDEFDKYDLMYQFRYSKNREYLRPVDFRKILDRIQEVANHVGMKFVRIPATSEYVKTVVVEAPKKAKK